MILQALKDYYDRKSADVESGIAPPGWIAKELPFLIVLDQTGNVVNVEDTREMVGKKKRAKIFLVAQEIKRSSGIAANFLWDNVEYVTGTVCKGKQARVAQQFASFRAELEPYADVPAISTVLRFLTQPNLDESLSRFPAWKEAKESCAFVSFKFAGHALIVFMDPAVRALVDNRGTAGTKEKQGVCLVSGSNEAIAALHPAIKGVQGTNTTGGNIVSFNFPAACSYGKEQGENAPVGKSATFAYTTALNTLLGKDSSQKLRVGDATTVFWADRPCDFENDIASFFEEPPKDNPDALTNHVAALLQSVESGSFADDDESARFFVLGLSPNSARIAIRFWHAGTVAELARRFAEYFHDLEITHGPKDQDHLSLWRLLVATAVQGKSENIAPNLAGNFMRAILEGLPFPESLLQATILRIKAEREVSYARAKLIKGCLNRKLRFNNPNQKRSLAVSLDREDLNIGYRLGRLFATLEKIQEEANPGINATIRDRFYAAASSTPQTVFPNLMRLKNHHLAKLENSGRRKNFEKLIGEIVDGFQTFPAQLPLDDQGRFAIGYYHQRQDFFTTKPEKAEQTKTSQA
ncbi:MAG: type I-C CRISPR-associated protein Cas8c/Csd1 [Bacteroidales bacterium]|nr:type I-C CRISPR-associated protein Cas8c/Csd1 [Bacteroidales bacterium]